MNVDLAALLRTGTPFIDVRAPAEFSRGTVPGAVSLPLVSDEERARIGITYKQQGHDAAVRVGHRLVHGPIRAERVNGWVEFARANPGAWIYCWRGGERSAIVQQWLAEAGIPLPRVPGGFKALRHTCIDTLEGAARDDVPWLILAGRTGSGKTTLLRSLPHAIDLEALAEHRGSAFGAYADIQPPPVTFENRLAVAWLGHRAATLVLEDESRTIGRLALPESWHGRMQASSVALLEVSLAERCANIEREYVTEPLADGVPPGALHARYSSALARIERRLGGLRRRDVQAALDHAFAHGTHTCWIERLLAWYYDPLYDYQLAAKRPRIVTQGDVGRVRAFLLEAA
ncbi:MAG: tRNA 2-selenouridine(34) synthase MnmH [Pseudomonadales bacterium]|nr:tRNA 2-selenouridine(34) synthase MnmH [Pseudomonadales bacterium]